VVTNEGRQTPLPAQLVNDDVGNASAERRLLGNGWALAQFVSRAGDALGDILGARAWLHGFRCAPGFRQQGTNESRVWPDELEIGSLATGLGAASSSCSYAAVAAARSAIQQGASLIPALAFMFASTNLVIELGAVLWILMGWQFVLAEIFGAFVLITIMWLLICLFLPRKLEAEIPIRAQEAIQGSMHCHREHPTSQDSGATGPPARSSGVTGDQEFATANPSVDGHEMSKWTGVAHAFVTDWSMLWKEIFGGFLIAGFLATLMPHGWWEALFLQSGPSVVRLIENALVGPLIAMISFVCSVGNIPLANLLWAHGISFGGVISFI